MCLLWRGGVCGGELIGVYREHKSRRGRRHSICIGVRGLYCFLTLAARGPGEGRARAIAVESVPALDALARVHARLGVAVRALDVAGWSDGA